MDIFKILSNTNQRLILEILVENNGEMDQPTMFNQYFESRVSSNNKKSMIKKIERNTFDKYVNKLANYGLISRFGDYSYKLELTETGEKIANLITSLGFSFPYSSDPYLQVEIMKNEDTETIILTKSLIDKFKEFGYSQRQGTKEYLLVKSNSYFSLPIECSTSEVLVELKPLKKGIRITIEVRIYLSVIRSQNIDDDIIMLRKDKSVQGTFYIYLLDVLTDLRVIWENIDKKMSEFFQLESLKLINSGSNNIKIKERNPRQGGI